MFFKKKDASIDHGSDAKYNNYAVVSFMAVSNMSSTRAKPAGMGACRARTTTVRENSRPAVVSEVESVCAENDASNFTAGDA